MKKKMNGRPRLYPLGMRRLQKIIRMRARCIPKKTQHKKHKKKSKQKKVKNWWEILSPPRCYPSAMYEIRVKANNARQSLAAYKRARDVDGFTKHQMNRLAVDSITDENYARHRINGWVAWPIACARYKLDDQSLTKKINEGLIKARWTTCGHLLVECLTDNKKSFRRSWLKAVNDIDRLFVIHGHHVTDLGEIKIRRKETPSKKIGRVWPRWSRVAMRFVGCDRLYYDPDDDCGDAVLLSPR